MKTSVQDELNEWFNKIFLEKLEFENIKYSRSKKSSKGMLWNHAHPKFVLWLFPEILTEGLKSNFLSPNPKDESETADRVR